MMELFALIGAAALVIGSQKFTRSYWFHRQGYEQDSLTRLYDEAMMCPVDGRVVYIKEVTDGIVRTEKKGTAIAENWVGKQDGVLIGIYMCIYDRHFIANPTTSVIRVRHEPTTANIPMMDLWEYINFYYFGRFVDWFEEKAFRYKLQNEKVIYDYSNGVKLMGIADKFVNKIEIPKLVDGHLNGRGDKIGHIRRGSQVDVFIPKELFDCWFVQVNEKVKVGNPLCKLKNLQKNTNHSAS